MKNDPTETKKALRLAFTQRARELSEEYRRGADLAIREAVLASRLWQEAEAVFLYVSMWAEPDTRMLLSAALEAGKRVYVPRCYPGRVMKAVRIRSTEALRPGTLGIPEPEDDSETAAHDGLDLAIVPCVCASADGRRLGHGAGYYDRFLAAHRVRALCLCHERLLSDEIPMEGDDVWMDGVVTERGLVLRTAP